MPELRIKQLDTAKGLSLPTYATEHSAGFDLASANESDIVLKPGERKLIPTGLIFELPVGYEEHDRPRSGLALKNGVTVLNTPGTIDSDYRGEVGIILINLGAEDFTITRGMRIAQVIIARHEKVDLRVVESVTGTTRGASGFGSTGTEAQKAA